MCKQGSASLAQALYEAPTSCKLLKQIKSHFMRIGASKALRCGTNRDVSLDPWKGIRYFAQPMFSQKIGQLLFRHVIPPSFLTAQLGSCHSFLPKNIPDFTMFPCSRVKFDKNKTTKHLALRVTDVPSRPTAVHTRNEKPRKNCRAIPQTAMD